MPKCASLGDLVRAFGFFLPRNTVGFQAMGQPWAHSQAWWSLEGQQAGTAPPAPGWGSVGAQGPTSRRTLIAKLLVILISGWRAWG